MRTELEQYIHDNAVVDVDTQFNDWAPSVDFTDADKVADILRKSETNKWAWCCAHVTVTFNGFEESDSRGGCSYDSAEAFRESKSYADMVNSCVTRLANTIAKIVPDAQAFHVAR